MHAENGWEDSEKGILSSSTSAVLLIHNIFQTTGLTGYQVVPTAREVISFGDSENSIASYCLLQVLCGLYSKTLSLLQGFPKEASYRHQTEQVVQQRMQIVQAESDIAVIEKKIGCGQVEELIDQVGGVLYLLKVTALNCLPYRITG